MIEMIEYNLQLLSLYYKTTILYPAGEKQLKWQ